MSRTRRPRLGRVTQTHLSTALSQKLTKRYSQAFTDSHNIYYKNSPGDEIANVNFLRRHRTCRGQRHAH